MAAKLDESKQAAKSAGQESFYSLFHFNDYLTRCATEGQMLAWTLLFNGVFSFEIRVEPQLDGGVAARRLLAESLPSSAVLHCPTGRVVVSCLSEMGEPIPVAIEVEPGEYQATLVRNQEAEFDHAFLESVADYAATGGPDWSILLQRVEA